MSNLANEVSQLCDSILIFQRHINKLKQQLFLFPEVSDALIWNHMIGGNIQEANKQNILIFLNSSKTKTNELSLDLLIFEYSTNKLKFLTRKEFIFIFLDHSRKGIDEIMEIRKRKFSYAKNHTPHYKITDLLTEILIKTLEYLQVKEKMKQNIFTKRKQPNFNIEKCDENHFLIFINQYQPMWLIEECQIVLSHILKLRKRDLKDFYYFFVPYYCQSKKLNPDRNILLKFQSLQLKQTYSTVIDHRKASHFGNKELKLKKTLYLK